ncbi:unnamed protein product [Rhizoctonia solani]|uniref:Ricin B lectin domain-containing protein n=1 Tax=Rhizoctonia solani TaxID=456999 RepID=A0A8H3GWS7_9AGAM|nr:unnamed protein product [Rhizoctonia solani]
MNHSLSPAKAQTRELLASVPQPGTYRIVNQLTGSVMHISSHNSSIVVTGEYTGSNDQQWRLQPSGDGFIFKNQEHGSYLAVSSTILNPLAYAGRYPTTFALLQTDDGYLIQLADDEPVLYATGNQVAIGPRDGNSKTWRFEHVG